MYPYFTDIDNEIISPETRAKLIEIGLAYGKEIMSKSSTEISGTHWNSIGLVGTSPDKEVHKAILAIPEIANFEKSLKIPILPCSLYYMLPERPDAKFAIKTRRHVDSGFRGCGILVPLWPIGEAYAGTVWWKDHDAITPLARRGYNGGKAALINTDLLHSVEHYDHLRFNFQFRFKDSYDTVLQAIVSDNFRKK